MRCSDRSPGRRPVLLQVDQAVGVLDADVLPPDVGDHSGVDRVDHQRTSRLHHIEVAEGDAVHRRALVLGADLRAARVAVTDVVLVDDVLGVDRAGGVLVLGRHVVVTGVEERVGQQAVGRLVEVHAVGLVVPAVGPVVDHLVVLDRHLVAAVDQRVPVAGVTGGSAGQQAVNPSHAKIRALVEQAMATLKNWRLLRKLRCSTTRIAALVKAVLTLHLPAQPDDGKGSQSLSGTRLLTRHQTEIVLISRERPADLAKCQVSGPLCTVGTTGFEPATP
ncbi:hypothetical protein SBRY_100230 [Actinacidiphila bryophytorum]|uniref:Uncharacterized protein n=1 Tax=Actinacidiphila bryophytorum TaxID=1436133 RepID=A0A9W4GYA2_9ACTN|nr:hypothetical protein SBRY_100230 [Actinacidiphila bryophytorum]